MKKSLRITLSVLSSVLIIGTFIITCIFTYKYHWNQAAYWWSWFGAIWLVDIFVGGYLFYHRNRMDESKTFWLLVMIVLPIAGAAIALIYNYKLQTVYGQPNNDHSILQSAIFRATESIKIYSNSLFLSNDTFNALNFARWKNVKIKIILQNNIKKQDFLLYLLQKSLEDKIELFFIDKEINESFIIFDEKSCLSTSKNFNFKNIYKEKIVKINEDLGKWNNIWKNDENRTSQFPLTKEKIKLSKKIKFKLLNIFYPFY